MSESVMHTDEWCASANQTRISFPVIAIYIVTKNMTRELHAIGRDRLREAGAPESAMKLHSCFGEEGKLQVFDAWETQEAFDEFLKYLGPVMEELGIELSLSLPSFADRGFRPAIAAELHLGSAGAARRPLLAAPKPPARVRGPGRRCRIWCGLRNASTGSAIRNHALDADIDRSWSDRRRATPIPPGRPGWHSVRGLAMPSQLAPVLTWKTGASTNSRASQGLGHSLQLPTESIR